MRLARRKKFRDEADGPVVSLADLELGMPGDEGFQVVDGLLLLGNDPVHQIPNRNHADDPAAFHHRQVAKTLLGNDVHALLDRLRGGNTEDRGTHDFSDRGLFRSFAWEEDLAGEIPLGDDADQVSVLEDRQGANLFFRHHSNGVVDRCRRWKRPHLSAFFPNQ